ncbi:MAG TPA: apolipoprotein N-acyltransferase, partial [Anaeromyxobacteraceae bacterium]|nr:apolipoprotein N-acyltransferase [Anaeromyxobacteraceae bacterium]
VVPWISLRQLDEAGRLELLGWVGLVPALVALATAAGPGEAALLGLAAGLACFYASIHWVSHAMTAFGGLSAGVAFVGLTALVLYMAAHWAAAFWATSFVTRRTGWAQWAVLPPIWVATELSRNHLFTGYPWANLGYTQVRTAAVAQLASLGGVYAVAALVVLVNGVLAAWWLAFRAGPGARRPWTGTAVAAAALAATLAYGHWNLSRVRREMAQAPWVKIGLVQANVSQEVKNQGPRYADRIVGRLWPLTLEADRRGAALVAWPEAAWPFAISPAIPSLRAVAPKLEPLSRAHVLLGAATVEWVPGPKGSRVAQVENSAFLLAPDLRVLDRYVKHHLVPFGEYVPLRDWLPFLRSVVPAMAPIAAGGRLEVMSFESGGRRIALAPMICFDAIFPEIARAFALQDADFLVNPTNDAWYGYSSGPYQFLAMVRMRAIETGRSVARPAYSGVSAIVYPTGEVAPGALEVGPVDPSRAPDPDEPARLLVGELPILGGRTPYTRFGDSFALACAAATGLLLAVAALRRPRPPGRP